MENNINCSPIANGVFKGLFVILGGAAGGTISCMELEPLGMKSKEIFPSSFWFSLSFSWRFLLGGGIWEKHWIGPFLQLFDTGDLHQVVEKVAWTPKEKSKHCIFSSAHIFDFIRLHNYKVGSFIPQASKGGYISMKVIKVSIDKAAKSIKDDWRWCLQDMSSFLACACACAIRNQGESLGSPTSYKFVANQDWRQYIKLC